MKHGGIRAILIIEKASGLPILFQQLDPRLTDIDPSLVSGFLCALQSFSREVIDSRISDFQIDYGKRMMTLVNGTYTIFAAFSDKVSAEIPAILRELQQEFEKEYFESGKKYEVGLPENQKVFEKFRERIVQRAGLQNISFSWVPVFATQKIPLWVPDDLRKLINGKNDIRLIVQNSNFDSENVFRMLMQLWTNGDLVFRNILEPTDVLIPTRELYKYLQTNSPEHKNLTTFAEDLSSLLPEIVPHLDGRTTVNEITSQFNLRVYQLLDYLFEKGAIDVLSPEKKRILWAKEILELAIQKALRFYKTGKVIEALRAAGNQLSRPENMSDIKIHNDGIEINYGFEMYEGLTPREVSDLHASWLRLIKRFISNLPDHKRTNYIKAVAESVQVDFLSKYSEKEMDGLDEISFFLEELLAFS